MFERFCMMQNLKALMQSALPEEAEGLQAQFATAFESEYQGSTPNDLWLSEGDGVRYRNTKKKTPLDDAHWALLEPWLHKNRRGNHARQSVLYQRSTHRYAMTLSAKGSQGSGGNSNVAWGSLDSDQWRAGRIQAMFVWPGDKAEIFAIVDEFLPLRPTSEKHDPWRRYRGAVAGRLFEDKVARTTIVHLDEISCHTAVIPFASPKLRCPCVHVLPLEKVCLDLTPLRFHIPRN